ncbi:MAG: RHS repeat-associated core domain-containing protein [Paludibacteraceae bacterium]|nr:RHS repeat-associated core domain-containing protein [Paludibacteraceae bacterium]
MYNATYTTDQSGDVAQYLAYTPYGETFIEERNVTPYKFNDSARREQNQAMLGLCRAKACLRAKHNGKELDQETGFYYYGARYYDPSAALWLGVDPLAEKYPDVSPYVYCMGNPVVLIDEDGCESRSFDDKVGDVLRDVTGMHSEIQEAKSVQPLAEALTVFTGAGLINDVVTLCSDKNLFGEPVSTTDKVLAAVDLATFGTASTLKFMNKVEKVANVADNLNIGNNVISFIKTLRDGYEK